MFSVRHVSRRAAAGVLALLTLVVLSGCPGSGGTSNEILIGHYGSLTGSEATFGTSTDNGIKMAVEEFNAAGGLNGKKVRLITYDDKGDAKEAGNAVTKLVTNDGVKAVIGQVASKLSLAGGPICQEHGVPMISPSSTNPKVTEIGTWSSGSASSTHSRVRSAPGSAATSSRPKRPRSSTTSRAPIPSA